LTLEFFNSEIVLFFPVEKKKKIEIFYLLNVNEGLWSYCTKHKILTFP
jgi:hypothetical protein